MNLKTPFLMLQRLVLVSALLLTYGSSYSQTSTLYDFNTSGQLSTLFNGSGTGIASVTQQNTGGISNSGFLSVPNSTVNAIYATKDSYSMGPVGSSYTFESFIKSEGNGGYGGMGFTASSPASPSSGAVYRPVDALGVSVHGGGFVFHNGSTNIFGNWNSPSTSEFTAIKQSTTCSDLINATNTTCGSPDRWYKIIFKLVRATSTTYNMRVEVWPANVNGTLRYPSEATAIYEVNGVTNTTITNAPSIHSYFNFSGWRITGFDNYAINLAGGATVVQAGAPVVLTTSVTKAGSVVTVNGNVSSENGSAVTERGFVYGTSANPTISNTKVVVGSGAGTFSGSTPALSSGTFYFRAYATNGTGTSYGAEFSETFVNCSPNVQFKLSPPNVTNSAIAGQAGSRTETFNSMATGVNLTSGTFAIGAYTKSNNLGTLRVLPSSVWGGTGTNFLAIYSGAVVSVNLTEPSRYVGFWWGAGDPANTVTIYGNCGGTEVQLGQFTTSTVIALLNQSTITAVDGTSYPSSQYRRSNAANEPFAYINLQLDDPNIYFTRLEFGGGGFEVDNITTSIGYGAATATTPSAPTITSASVSNGSATVDFTAPSSNGGSAITNYEYSIDGGTTWTAFSPTTTTSPVVIPGITSSNYTINLRAVNSIGSGATSNTYTNTPPTITSLVNQTTTAGTPATAQNFTVADNETAAANLTVTASSSNTTLIPNLNIVLSGSGSTRNVVVTPASGQSGTATITLTVTDAVGASANTTFTVTVSDPSCSTFLPSDFRLNGNATLSNNIITLTTAAGNQRGGAWNVNKIFLDKDFDISSKINLGTNDATGADGIAFVLQNQSINAGSTGGGLGYQGITPSFAVEFDTWNNGSFEPTQDHMAIIANGVAAGPHNTYATPFTVQMEDGQWHSVRFVWTASTKNFQAWYDGVKRFDITVDLKASIFNNAEYVYWGFTAATGGSVNLQRVEILDYCYTKQASITPKAGTNNSSAALNLCAGSDVVLEASTGSSYQWFKDEVAIPGAVQQTLTVTESGSYKVETVTNGSSTVSAATTVTVSALPNISYPSASYSFIRNNSITSISPVLASGSPAPSSYSVAPALPTGLTLNTTTGVISGRPTALAATADYTVTARTSAGCTVTYTLSLEVKNDVAPSNLVYNPDQQMVRQGMAITNMVPTVSGGTVITYTISPALPPGIVINSTTGIISGTLSSTQTGSQVYTVTATNTGGSATDDITLIFNSAPTDIVSSASSIVENNAAGAVVSTLSSIDPDAGDTHTYTLVSGAGSTDNANFSFIGNRLRVNTSLDFETKSSYSIRIRTTDAGGLSYEEVFVISVLNLNEAPTNITLSRLAIYDGNAIGALIGNLSSTDPDANDTHSYSLVSGQGSTDNSGFTISSNQLRAAVVFDFKKKETYSIRVRTTDAGGLSFEKIFTITIVASPVATGTGNTPGTNQITAASNNVTISKGYSSQLRVTGTGLVTYSWSPSVGLSATNIANPIASPSQTTTYAVTVTNNLGLSTVVYVTVNVVEDYNITPTNIITPNGDGINDNWVVDNLESYPDNEVQIFDKAGRVLYQVKNYQNNWDGTINSNLLAEGTYYYVISFGPGKSVKKGYITIIRN